MKIPKLWKKYNNSANDLKKSLGRTSNLVGEYAEYIANKYLNGKLLSASNASADIELPNGDLYQVKSRKINRGLTEQLSIIRSWDFDYLLVVLFDDNGLILKGLICPSSTAKKYAKANKHQNGWVLTTTSEFLNDTNNNDVTDKLKEINEEVDSF